MSVDIPIALRRVVPEDEAFLEAVYASTRAEEMAIVPWTAEQKLAFVQMQYRAQRESYRNEYPEAQTYVIEQGGEPIGRMIIDRSTDVILLMDITLLPEHRNRGIGTMLMRELMDEADREHRPVQLHVEDFNPARNLYLRLGFVKTGEAGIYSEMIRQPMDGRSD